ncbi:MAG: hypothetical protein ACLSII_03230 [Ruminococcus sp.]
MYAPLCGIFYPYSVAVAHIFVNKKTRLPISGSARFV